MDFVSRQAQVRRSTHVLVGLFAAAVAAIVLAMDGLLYAVIKLFLTPTRHHADLAQPVVQYHLLLWSSLLSLAFIVGCALYRMHSLAAGGAVIARQLGGVPVAHSVDEPALRQLRNVIEEMAIASGVPVPAIYLLPNEWGINAFAAGYSVSDAVICVTQGCVAQLNRDELQGVIAHEFSHVLNGDMRLNIRLIGLLYGIMAISVVGWSMIADDRGGNEDVADRVLGALMGFVMGSGLIVIGSLGYLFGRLIQAAVSRSREALADASAVQFTRQTNGLAGALKKIALSSDSSFLRVGNRHEVAHMTFGDVDDQHDWFANHPPLMARIKALEPWFTEQHLARLEQQRDAAFDAELAKPERKPRELAPLEWNPTAAALPVAVAATPVSAVAPSTTRVAPAASRKMPATLMRAARDPAMVLPLIFALACSSQDDLRQRQRRFIANAFDDDVMFAAEQRVAEMQTLAPAQRMPLIAVAMPALRQLPPAQLQRLQETLEAIVRVDSRVTLDDYCLVRLLRMYLREAVAPRRAPVDGKKKLPACRASFALVCTVLAVYGAEHDDDARKAWQAAMSQAFQGEAFAWQRLPADWQVKLDQALDDLDGLLPMAKDILLQSLHAAIQSDGVVTPSEKELLRVICASLHCPLPSLSAAPLHAA